MKKRKVRKSVTIKMRCGSTSFSTKQTQMGILLASLQMVSIREDPLGHL